VKDEKEFPKGANMKPPEGSDDLLEAFIFLSSINPKSLNCKGGW